MVFCEPRTLRDPSTVGPTGWVRDLNTWSDRAILCDLDLYGWSRIRWNEQRLGSPVVAPTLAGIGAWADGKTQITEANAADRASFPRMLAELPERWLTQFAPPERQVAELCNTLQDYLGLDGYDCLRACAVYPILCWPLTLFFASRLAADTAERTRILERLVRLPWYRDGSMPDWLRIRLVAGFSPRQEDYVRALLDQFLNGPARGSRGAIEQVEPIEVVRRWSRNARPIRDPIFLSFLGKKRLDRLSVRTPKNWRRLLLHFGIWLQPQMLLTLMVILACAAGGGWLAATGVRSRWMETQTKILPQNLPPQPKVGATDAFLARLLDVAASQVGRTPGRGARWDLRRNGLMGGSTFIQWALDATGAIVSGERDYTTLAGDAPGRAPGMLCWYELARVGHQALIESRQGPDVTLIEPGSNSVVGRNTLPRRSTNVRYIDPSRAPLLTRLPDAVKGRSYRQSIARAPDAPEKLPSGIQFYAPNAGVEKGERAAAQTISGPMLAGTPTVAGSYHFSIGGGSYQLVVQDESESVMTPLDISPQTLDFGPQNVRTTSAEKTVTIKNASETPVSIALTIPNGQEFDFVQDGCLRRPIAPGMSCAVQVVYRPLNEGPSRQAMIITSGTSTFGVDFRGTGVRPGTHQDFVLQILPLTPGYAITAKLFCGSGYNECIKEAARTKVLVCRLAADAKCGEAMRFDMVLRGWLSVSSSASFSGRISAWSGSMPSTSWRIAERGAVERG
jgi:hypothetical protein